MDKKLNVLFIPTMNSSVMWWRMQSFVEAAWRNQVANFVNPLWEKDLNHCQLWQGKISDGPKYDPIFIRMFVPMIESGCVKADAVVMQFVQEEGGIELFDAIKTKFPNLPIFTEIDDNILSVPIYNEAFEAYGPNGDTRQRVIEQLRKSDGVITTTPFLKELYSEFNRNIHVIPNSIDFGIWDKVKRKPKGGIRIGWAGGNAHGGDFEPYEPAIKNILSRHKDVKFVFVNGPARMGVPESLKGLPGIEHHALWEPILKYPAMLGRMDFDIAISPLMDSAFNRGKSNLKWLEASALSIPTVASNVGHLKETIKHGVNGLLADTPGQFETHLESLITDKKLRRSMGVAANAAVRLDFNVDNTVNQYVSILSQEVKIKAAFQEFQFSNSGKTAEVIQ